MCGIGNIVVRMVVCYYDVNFKEKKELNIKV